MAEVTQVAPVPPDARRIRLVASELVEPQAIVGGQAVEPAAPAPLAVFGIAPADHRRLDDELFPLPRRAQRARDNRVVVGIERRRRVVFLVGVGFVEKIGRRQRLVGWNGRRRGQRQLRHLSEGEIFVEALGGEPLGPARDEREERPAGRIGPAGAAIEPGRHASPIEGVLEQPEVGLRRAQNDGHVVERHAARGLVERAARDLERLAPLARRGEQAHVAVRRARGRRLGGEDVAAEVGEVRFLRRRVLGGVLRRAERRHRLADAEVVRRRRHARLRRAPAERRGERPLGRRVERHVEQHDRQARPAHAGRPRPAGGGEQRGAILDGRRGQLRFDARQQAREIGRPLAVGRERGGGDAREPQLVHRARQRAREPRHARYRREVRQVARRPGVERHARRDSFGAGGRARRLRSPLGARRRRARGELGQAEAVKAEQGAAAPEITREVVRGAARRRDDEPLGGRREGVEEPPGPIRAARARMPNG